MIALFTTAFLVFQQAPTLPPTTDAPHQTHNDRRVSAQQTDDPERLVCRRERVLGSNRMQRVCMTAGQWAGITDDAREAARRFDRGEMQEIRSR